jgi:hypothetical protein
VVVPSDARTFLSATVTSPEATLEAARGVLLFRFLYGGVLFHCAALFYDWDSDTRTLDSRLQTPAIRHTPYGLDPTS